jgi:hypothetical protein
MPFQLPYRVPTPEEEKRQPAHKWLQSALPWLGGGALATAGVSEALRRGFITPEIQNDMLDFSRKLDLDKTFQPYVNLPDDQQAVQAIADYAVQGNKLLKNRFFGGMASPTSLIKAVRSWPWLDPKDKWETTSQQHYDAFERGPAAGMVRVLGEMSLDRWDKPGQEGARLPDAVRDSIRDATNQLAGHKYVDTHTGNTLPDGGAWRFPAVGLPEDLTTEQQLKLMRNLGPAIKDDLVKKPDGLEMWHKFVDNLKVNRSAVYTNYRKLTDTLHTLNNRWGGANLLLAGGGAAALGGYGAWKYMDHARKQKQQKARQAKQASWGSSLLKLLGASAATGAIVGGHHLHNGVSGTKDKLDRLLDNAGDTAAATAKSVQMAQPVVQKALEGVNGAVQMVDQRTKAIAPVLGGVAGAGIGHLLGALQERAGEQNLEELRKQKRNRILLTLLGGAGGVYAGMRTAQGKQANQRSLEKLRAVAPDAMNAAYLKKWGPTLTKP